MRGKDESSGRLFSYVDLEARVPRDDSLRAIRDLTNAALVEMSGKFEGKRGDRGTFQQRFRFEIQPCDLGRR